MWPFSYHQALKRLNIHIWIFHSLSNMLNRSPSLVNWRHGICFHDRWFIDSKKIKFNQADRGMTASRFQSTHMLKVFFLNSLSTWRNSMKIYSKFYISTNRMYWPAVCCIPWGCCMSKLYWKLRILWSGDVGGVGRPGNFLLLLHASCIVASST